MAAARYWRLVGVETRAGGSLELSSVSFSGAAGVVSGTATIACSHTPIAGALDSLQDGDAHTTVLFAGEDVAAGGFWISWDFGAAVDITSVAFGGAGVARYPQSVLLQGKDGAVWGSAVQIGGGEYPGDGVLSGYNGSFNADLLLHFDDLTDSSLSGKTVSLVGGATLTSADRVFGTSSLRVVGNGAAALVPHSAAWDFGADDFIIDFRFKIDSPVMAINRALVVHDNIGGTRGWLIFLSDTAEVAAGTLTAAFWHGSNVLVLRWGTIPQPGIWYRASCRRIAGVFELWVDQVRVAVDAAHKSVVVNNPATPLTVGNLMFLGAPINAPLRGNIEELVSIKGAGHLIIDPSVPRHLPYGYEAGAAKLSNVSAAGVAASSLVPPHSAASAPPLLLARDVEYGGLGTVYGTTKTKGTPNLPTKARVVLLHQRSKLPVRETWSDPTTGYFEFRGIDTNQQFLTLAEDAEGHFRAVAANRLTPEVLA